jgi:thioredoxin-like negative regulator of GroEL
MATFPEVTTEKDLQLAIATAGARVVCVKFTATWCRPCTQLHPVLEALAKQHQNVLVYTADLDKATELVNRYDIRAVPTMIFFWRNKVIHMQAGGDKATLATAFEVANAMAGAVSN